MGIRFNLSMDSAKVEESKSFYFTLFVIFFVVLFFVRLCEAGTYLYTWDSAHAFTQFKLNYFPGKFLFATHRCT